ncbi:hypothetical protein M9H77_05831 [Catharanthus roseus]|uniref:Uncharacterized protein n=1 Tax=Catharanthus roseus TaxID=4058 RepID=A0ACC0BQD3_CATRO|nr:hypothetical protein M9H77_05831 [Catharanthus roseus]
MDGQRGERSFDRLGLDSQRNSHSDDSFSNHHSHDNIIISPGEHHHRRNCLLDQRPHPSSNNELHDSSTGPGPGPWEGSNYSHSMPQSGRKRQFSHFAQGSSPDLANAAGFVKLYVGGIPRTATEEDIRSVFAEHGSVVEVVLLKDKRTSQLQVCCFVKYATFEEANVAIGRLHGQYTFFGGVYPIKVKYADGERERLEKMGVLQSLCSTSSVPSAIQKNYGGFGEHLFKLYVGCVSKQASKREIDEIFSQYGDVEDIFIVKDEMKQHRGCAFVQFSRREMAIAAINALHGTYIMRGCEQPLIVRFADPKKPRGLDSRAAPHLGDRMGGHMGPNDFHPVSPKRSAQTGNKPQSVPCPNIGSGSGLLSSSSSCQAVPTSTEGSDYIDCDWSEHICPDGYPYYYNCVTCEMGEAGGVCLLRTAASTTGTATAAAYFTSTSVFHRRSFSNMIQFVCQVQPGELPPSSKVLLSVAIYSIVEEEFFL